ncbi:hypothetical protein ACX1NB_01050 [Mycoplasma sp. HF14]
MKIKTLGKILSIPSFGLITLACSCQNQNDDNDNVNNVEKNNLYVKAFMNEANSFINNYTNMQKQIVEFILQQGQINPDIQKKIQNLSSQAPSVFNKYFLPFAEQKAEKNNIFKAKYKDFLAIYSQKNITSFALANAMQKFVKEITNEANNMLATLDEYFSINNNFSQKDQIEYDDMVALSHIYYIQALYAHISNNLNYLKAIKTANVDKIKELENKIKSNLTDFYSLFSIYQDNVFFKNNYNSGLKVAIWNLENVVKEYKENFGMLYLQSLPVNKDKLFSNSFSSMYNDMKVAIRNSEGLLEPAYLYINPKSFSNAKLEEETLVREINNLKKENYTFVENYLKDNIIYDKKLVLKSNLTNNVPFNISLASRKNGHFNTAQKTVNTNFGEKLSLSKHLQGVNYLMRMQVNENQLHSLGISLVDIIQNPILNNQNLLLSQPTNLAGEVIVKNNFPTIRLAQKEGNYIIPTGWDTILYPNKKLNISYNFPNQVKLSIYNIYFVLDKATYEAISSLEDNASLNLEFI